MEEFAEELVTQPDYMNLNEVACIRAGMGNTGLKE